MKKKHEIDFFNETTTKFKQFPKLLKEIVTYALSEVLKIDRSVYLSLTLTSRERIHELNKTYRSVDRATDVLSFPSSTIEEIRDPNEKSQLILGDIFICLEVANKQAEELNHSLLYEVCFLFVHGLLHLSGINHDTDEEYAIMQQTMKDIITKKGESIDPWNILN